MDCPVCLVPWNMKSVTPRYPLFPPYPIGCYLVVTLTARSA